MNPESGPRLRYLMATMQASQTVQLHALPMHKLSFCHPSLMLSAAASSRRSPPAIHYLSLCIMSLFLTILSHLKYINLDFFIIFHGYLSILFYKS